MPFGVQGNCCAKNDQGGQLMASANLTGSLFPDSNSLINKVRNNDPAKQDVIDREASAISPANLKETQAESLIIMEQAALARGLSTQVAGNLGTKHAGTVVAQSTHHMLLKVDHKTAIRFEQKDLDVNMNLKIGDRLTLQNQEFKLDRSRKVSESNGIERSPSPHREG